MNDPRLNSGQQKVLDLIRRFDGACKRHFNNEDISRYGARIFELRKMGYRIVQHKCRHHDFHKTHVVEYRLLATPALKGYV